MAAEYTHNFENLTEENTENMEIVGIANRQIGNIHLSSWIGDFKSMFDTYGGALVIIVNNFSHPHLNQIMNDYGEWALKNIHKDVDLSPIKSKWVIDAKNEKNELETYTISTLVKGQLLIISGRIPIIYVDLEKSFCREAVDSDLKTPYLMMAVFQYITYRKFHSLSCLQDDVDKKIKIIADVTPLMTRYLKDYLDSQRKNITEVSNFLSQLRKYSFILKANINYYGSCSTPRNALELLAKQIEKRDMITSKLMNELDNAATTLNKNRERRFKCAMKIIIGICVGALGVWGAIDLLVQGEKNVTSRVVLLVSRCVSLATIIIEIVIYVIMKWGKIKLTAMEDV